MSNHLDVTNKKIVVVGMARSGCAAARLLLRHGAQVMLIDQKPAEQLAAVTKEMEELGVTVKTNGQVEGVFDGADLIVISPGVPINQPMFIQPKADQIPIWSELELAAHFCDGKIVAVTGTNGKTTTVNIVFEMLQAAGRSCLLAGNVGQPFCEVAEQADKQTVVVLEVSSFQLETIEHFRPMVAAILNITPDHLDRYEGMQAYVEAKAAIMNNQTAKDVLVLNSEDKYTPLLSNQVPGRLLTFSRRRPPEIEGCWVEDGLIYYRYFGLGQEKLMLADELLISGPHNLENALAAISMGLALEISPSVMTATLKRFKGIPHRLEIVNKTGGTMFVNDSKATNVDAVAKALESFDKPIVLILGGRDKQGDFKQLNPLIDQQVRAVVVMGEAASVIKQQLAVTCPIKKATDLGEAVQLAYNLAQPQDVVLLSPGCSSFDQYPNYAKRGEHFTQLVKQLIQQVKTK